MPRRPKPRLIKGPPIVDRFCPYPFCNGQTGDVFLPLEGLEAIRLIDYAGLSQEEAAAQMDVSRPTFGRILMEARRTVAQALVQGKTIRIEGGHFRMPSRGGRRQRRRGGPF